MTWERLWDLVRKTYRVERADAGQLRLVWQREGDTLRQTVCRVDRERRQWIHVLAELGPDLDLVPGDLAALAIGSVIRVGGTYVVRHQLALAHTSFAQLADALADVAREAFRLRRRPRRPRANHLPLQHYAD